ncbi:MAG: hypothetical protein CFE24_12250 [Flavobacterium sp. BFFFF2]|nr:MAG: hypothetical protein CFE24_12250 [Flavobacterium sp. BFFFF2]
MTMFHLLFVISTKEKSHLHGAYIRRWFLSQHDMIFIMPSGFGLKYFCLNNIVHFICWCEFIVKRKDERENRKDKRNRKNLD